MFNQVSANIAAQKQASLFEGSAEDFALVAQDAKGKDVEVASDAGKSLFAPSLVVGFGPNECPF